MTHRYILDGSIYYGSSKWNCAFNYAENTPLSDNTVNYLNISKKAADMARIVGTILVITQAILLVYGIQSAPMLITSASLLGLALTDDIAVFTLLASQVCKIWKDIQKIS